MLIYAREIGNRQQEPKTTPTNERSLPFLLFPGGRMAFAELKAPGKKPRPLQEARLRQLRALGYQAYVIDNTDMIGGILDEICTP